MKRKSWKLALSSLDAVLETSSESDDETVSTPDTDSLLLRSEVRLRLGDKAGALRDALTVTDSISLTHSKAPRAIVLKAQVDNSSSSSF